MQQIIINGTSEEECRILLSDAMAKYGIKSSNCRNWNLKWKKTAEIDYVEIPDDTKLSTMPKVHAGKEEGTLSTPLALIMMGIVSCTSWRKTWNLRHESFPFLLITFGLTCFGDFVRSFIFLMA